MPLTQTECDIVYAEVQEILRQIGLSWVVEQVLAEVRFGIPEQKEVETYETPKTLRSFSADAGQAPQRSRRKSKFDSVREPTPSEKLKLLIDAAYEVVVRVTEIEGVLSDPEKSPIASGFHRLEFASEDGTVTHAVDAGGVLGRRQRVEAAKRLLEELRGDL